MCEPPTTLMCRSRVLRSRFWQSPQVSPLAGVWVATPGAILPSKRVAPCRTRSRRAIPIMHPSVPGGPTAGPVEARERRAAARAGNARATQRCGKL